ASYLLVVVVLDEVAEQAIGANQRCEHRPQRLVGYVESIRDLMEQPVGRIRAAQASIEAALVGVTLPIPRIELAPVRDADDDERHAHRVSAVSQPREDGIGDAPAALPLAIRANIELATRWLVQAIHGVPGFTRV